MKRYLAISAVCAVLGGGTIAFAFEEQKLPAAKGAAAGVGQAVGGASGTQLPIELTDPGVAMPKSSSGTKIRVPGLGVIGEIPKMDFGLELLYGASQPKQLDSDRTEANGVMGRVTVPLKSR